MPRVSFILPAYKRRFLKEAIASILAQTCRDFELVVVDDCSPENLKEIAEGFCDERLSYHRNETNLGGRDLVAAWNHAMEYARGEYSILASDDDIYAPEYLEEMLSLAVKYPMVDVFHCREVVINADGSWRRIGEPRAEYETGVEMLYYRGVRRFQQTMPDFMFRTAALRAIGGFVWTQKAWYSDDATWMRLSRDNGACCSPRPLFFWRASGDNITTLCTDSVQKLKAHEVFRKWVHELIEEEVPMNEVDRHLIELVRSDIDGTIDSLTRWVLDQTPFLLWVKTVSTAEMPLRFRLSCIKARIKRILDVRNMFLRHTV